MPLIKMKATASGSDNGISISSFSKGHEYNVSIDLAKSFIQDMDIAEYVNETKAVVNAPENKAMETPIENKTPRVRRAPVETDTKMHVYQLAEKLNVSTKELIKLAKEKESGIGKIAPATKLTEEQIEILTKKVKQGK